jgi:cell division protein FtsQ
MSAVAAPADRRFRRAHVKPARKRRTWVRLARLAAATGLLVAIAVYAAARGVVLLARTPVLQVARITVRGNERLSDADVLAALNGLRGESLLWTDLEEWRRRLLASPWVADAAIRRTLPSTVEVFVRERQPIGIARMGNDMYLVDESGVIVDRYGPQYADLDLPIIDGLPRPSSRDTAATDEARASLAARVITALRSRPEVARQLSQVDVTDANNASVLLSGDSALIQLGDDQFLQRLQEYLELAPALRERVPDIDSVDVRFDSRIYVRPARTTANEKAAARARESTKKR